MTETTYSYDEAAARIGISRRSLDRLKHERRIGYYRHGSRVTFGESHIAAYLASVEVKPKERKAS